MKSIARELVELLQKEKHSLGCVQILQITLIMELLIAIEEGNR
jgi:hypothetical protein